MGGRYWLPAYQRVELQAGLGPFADTRGGVRIVSRLRDYALDELGVARSPDDVWPHGHDVHRGAVAREGEQLGLCLRAGVVAARVLWRRGLGPGFEHPRRDHPGRPCAAHRGRRHRWCGHLGRPAGGADQRRRQRWPDHLRPGAAQDGAR